MKKLILSCIGLLGMISAQAEVSYVLTDFDALKSNDVVVIVDQATSKAMTNNTGTGSAPAATEITLNADNSEISGVTEEMLFTVTKTTDGLKFGVGESFLYATNTNNGVRIGSNSNNVFSWEKATTNNNGNGFYYLKNNGTSRFIGVYNGQDWRCYSSVNANIQNTRTAFYVQTTVVSDDPTITVASTLDFGANLEVPAAKTLAVSGSNLSEAITYSWETDGIFTAEGILTAEGGNLTIALDKTAVGEYSDKLILTSGITTVEVTVTASIVTLAGTGEGTEANPYDVARALDIISKGLATTENVYVAGVVNAVTEVSTQHGNATFTIVDAGETAPLTVFRAKYLENKAFTDEDQIKVADEVVVVGVLKDYNGTPESTNGYIVSLERKEKKVTTIDVTGDDTVEIGETIELTAKIMFGEEEVEGTVTFTSSDEGIATVDANGVVTGVSQGKVTITANYAGDEEYTLSSAEFSVTVKKPVGEITEGDVVFGPDWNTLFDTTYNGQINLKNDEKLTLNGSENGIDLTVTNGASTNGYVKDNDFRVYNGYTMTFTAPDGFVITDIVTTKGGKTYSSGVSSTKGTISINNNATTWNGSEKTVVWTISGTVSFANITVTLAKDNSSAIESIEAEDGAARFFNLQGVEVANPVSGQLYIRVQGGKATKVLVK